MSELVSIIVPAYNAEKWIAETIRSALAQDWPRKELIIVDDGSTDHTLAVARSFESADVKVVTQQNRGAGAARNRGLSLAQGDYIQWLDADDLLAPDKISRQMRGAEAGAKSRVLLSGRFGEFLVRPERARFSPNALWQDLEPIDFLLTRFTQNVWLANSAWLVSRRLTDLAGTWDERLSLNDDGEYFARASAKSVRIRFVPGATVYYRRGHLWGLSQTVSDRACESLLLSLRLCIGHLRALEESERTRAASLSMLQTWVDGGGCFYPHREDVFRRICELGQEVGGELRAPSLSWKYQPIRALFGWEGVRWTRILVSRLKLLARIQRERLGLSVSKQIN